jgi:uncharacterized membrane protein YeaQ/YmgE (transglycosylase-associated protein family)
VATEPVGPRRLSNPPHWAAGGLSYVYSRLARRGPDRRLPRQQGDNKTGEGLGLDIVLGIVGAIVGGFLFNQFGHSGATGINLYSIFVAFIGSVVVLLIYHMVFRRRRI